MANSQANSDLAASLLRDAILSGELKPRQRLIEADLSERFHMSRTPVREAIKRLVPLGLVVVEPYKGATVADIDTRKIREIYEVRIMLEGRAAVRAADSISVQELDALEKILDEMESIGPRSGQLQVLNEQFHMGIYAHCGNDVLLGIINDLLEQSALFRRTAMESEKNQERIRRNHRDLLQALRERDKERIAEISADHIRIYLVETLVG